MSVFQPAHTHFARAAAVMAALGMSISLAQAQSPAAIRQAVESIKAGNHEPLSNLKDEFGDKLLPRFAEARFDKDVRMRRTALDITGDSYESLLFVLPMIEDENQTIATTAIGQVTVLSRSQEQFRRLSAQQIVPRLAAALAKHPKLHQNFKLLLLLAQFKNDPMARRLLGQLLKENGWNNFFNGNTPTAWDAKTVVAMLAQCEMGRLSASQVQTVFDSDPEARLSLLNYVNLLTDKSLLRYALSLLYDTTFKRGSEDEAGWRMQGEVWLIFRTATKIDIRRIKAENNPEYNKLDIARLYAFYGLTEK